MEFPRRKILIFVILYKIKYRNPCKYYIFNIFLFLFFTEYIIINYQYILYIYISENRYIWALIICLIPIWGLF